MPGIVAALTEKGRNFSVEALVAYYEAMIARPDRTPVLKETSVPVLFVIGEFDGTVPPADSLQQSHLPAISAVHLLKESSHMGMLEETEKANLLLESFLNFVNEQSAN